MIWLTWRQFRTQAWVAVAALGALAVTAVVSELHVSQLYTDSGLATCTAHCDQTASDFLSSAKAGLGYTLFDLLGHALYVVPAVVGIFWGAPLIARELEAGTHRLAWNQSVTRRRWLAVKLIGIGGASIAAVGLASLAITGWATLYDKVGGDRLSPIVFGERDIVPIGYAAFAFAVGVTSGLLLRRTVPAMAVTLVVTVAAMLLMPYVVRAHLIPPVHGSTAFDPNAVNGITMRPGGVMHVVGSVHLPGAWVITNQTVTATGKPFAGPADPSACGPDAGFQKCLDWLGSLGLRQDFTYQPASRFWALQGIETSIFIGLAVLLCGFCFRWIRRRMT